MKLIKIVRGINNWIDERTEKFMRKYLGEVEFPPQITNYIEGAQLDYRGKRK